MVFALSWQLGLLALGGLVLLVLLLVGYDHFTQGHMAQVRELQVRGCLVCSDIVRGFFSR